MFATSQENAVAVAELTFGLLLAIDRRIADGVIDLREGYGIKNYIRRPKGCKEKQWES